MGMRDSAIGRNNYVSERSSEGQRHGAAQPHTEQKHWRTSSYD